MRFSGSLLIVTIMGLAAGYSLGPASIGEAESSERIERIIWAVHANDQGSIPWLISLLDSDDPIIRMLAIRALEDMTGLTHGYDHAAREWERDKGVDRWARWYQDQERTVPALEPDESGKKS